MVRLENRKPMSPPSGTNQPRRPPSIRQRISGKVPTFPRRRSTPRIRPSTAPNVNQDLTDRAARQAPINLDDSQSTLVAEPELPDENCPYDPNTYQSFPSIDKPRCWSCRFPNPWSRNRRPPIRPCSACRSRSPLSHIATNQRSPTSRRPTTSQGTLLTVFEELLPARPVAVVPEALRAGRPRTAKVPRFPPLDTLNVPKPNSSNERPPTRRGDISDAEHGFTFGTLREQLPTSPRRPRSPRSPPSPESPRLHHIHGLPHAHDHPYVHKHEVKQHLQAIRAGRHSPVKDHQNRPQTASGDSVRPGTGRDYSDTVFYGYGTPPILPDPPISSSRGISHQHTSVTVTATSEIEHPVTPFGRRGQHVTDHHVTDHELELELYRSRVYQLRSPSGQRSNTPSPLRQQHNASENSSSNSSRSGGTMPPTPAEVDGARLELRGGNLMTGVPRLRGGGGDDVEYGRPLRVGLSRSYRYKEFLLTCQGPCEPKWVEYLEDDLPPARPLASHHITRRIGDAYRRVPLPKHIHAHRAMLQSRSGFPSVDHHTSRFRVRSLNRMHGLRIQTSPQQPEPTPCLRGGGGPGWVDNDPLPKTLWRLAMGTGKPITVAQWNRQKPQRRMSGLLGMAIYGHKAGTPYNSATSSESSSDSSGGVVVAAVDVGSATSPSSNDPGGSSISSPGSGSSPSHTPGTSATTERSLNRQSAVPMMSGANGPGPDTDASKSDSDKSAPAAAADETAMEGANVAAGENAQADTGADKTKNVTWADKES